MAGVRRKARTLALQALFESDCRDRPAQATLDRIIGEIAVLEEASAIAQKVASYQLGRALEREVQELRQAEPFARELVTGAVKHRRRLDQAIACHAPERPVRELFGIDRAILRIAIFEILFDNRTPPKVAVSEAVELAKLFGSDASPKFVNGVLGAVLREHQGVGEV